jgi:uncharacterized protein YtpQ (UPF0354 family)
MSIPPREEFPALVMKMVKAKFPLVKIAQAKDGFAVTVNGNLATLENLYRMATLQPDGVQQHVNRWVVELLRAAEGTHDQEGTFEQLKVRLLPLVLSSEGAQSRGPSVVTQPLVDGLIVAYAIDSDRTISYLSKAHFASWNITMDALHDTAMENLVSRSEAMNAHAAQDEEGKVNLILFQQMDGYDASRILLPTLHERLREHLGSPFAAAIPNRDILICFRHDLEMLDRLREKIAEDYRSMPHQVTDRLFLVTADGIAPLTAA